MEPPPTLSAVAAFTIIVNGLMQAIAAKIQDYPCTSEMVLFLWKRVNRAKNRFLALAASIAAGKIPRERGVAPRAREPADPAKPPGINWRKWLPQSRFGWLCQVMPSRPGRFGAAQFATGLRQLLGEPEMRAILAATPKAGRLLAPLCFMLGIEASLLRPVPPPPVSDTAGAAAGNLDQAPSAPAEARAWPPPSVAPPARTARIPDRPGAKFFTV